MSKWGTAVFDDILKIINGRNQKNVENPNGQYPIYGSGGIMGYADDYLCEENTVIIGRKGTINKPIYVDEPFWNVDTAFGLRSNEDVLFPKYLYYFCERFNFEELNTTVTIPSLTKANLLKIQIPLPPLPIQQKIADVLDRAGALIEKRKAQIAKMDLLMKSQFVEMFGDPVTNPMSWDVKLFGDVFTIIDGDRGVNYPKVEDFFDNGYCLFLNAGNVTVTGFDFSKNQFITRQKDEQLRKGRLLRDDIVLTTRGTVGNIAIFDQRISYEVMRINSGMVLLRDFSSFIEPEYFVLLIRSFGLLSKYLSGSAQPQMPISTMKSIPVILPPLDLQNRFADFVRAADKSKFEMQQGLEKLEVLYKALMQNYFSGEMPT